MLPIMDLEQLSVDSRDPQQIAMLVERQIPEQATRLLSQQVAEVAAAGPAQELPPALRSSLLLTLRIVRNLCAAGDDALKQLQCADAAAWLASSACTLLNLQPGGCAASCHGAGWWVLVTGMTRRVFFKVLNAGPVRCRRTGAAEGQHAGHRQPGHGNSRCGCQCVAAAVSRSIFVDRQQPSRFSSRPA